MWSNNKQYRSRSRMTTFGGLFRIFLLVFFFCTLSPFGLWPRRPLVSSTWSSWAQPRKTGQACGVLHWEAPRPPRTRFSTWILKWTSLNLSLLISLSLLICCLSSLLSLLSLLLYSSSGGGVVVVVVVMVVVVMVVVVVVVVVVIVFVFVFVFAVVVVVVVVVVAVAAGGASARKACDQY